MPQGSRMKTISNIGLFRLLVCESVIELQIEATSALASFHLTSRVILLLLHCSSAAGSNSQHFSLNNFHLSWLCSNKRYLVFHLNLLESFIYLFVAIFRFQIFHPKPRSGHTRYNCLPVRCDRCPHTIHFVDLMIGFALFTSHSI